MTTVTAPQVLSRVAIIMYLSTFYVPVGNKKITKHYTCRPLAFLNSGDDNSYPTVLE